MPEVQTLIAELRQRTSVQVVKTVTQRMDEAAEDAFEK
jgi:hypothetical protein